MTIIPIFEGLHLLLNIPLIVGLIAISRYVIGFRTWKIYPTLALALSFYFFATLPWTFDPLSTLVTGAFLWMLCTLIIVGTGSITKKLLRKLNTNYYARLAIVFWGGTTAFFLLLSLFFIAIPAMFPSFTHDIAEFLVSKYQAPTFALALLFIFSTLDEFATVLYKKDRQEYFRRLGTTITLAFISGLILIFPWWKEVLTHHQELLLPMLIIDFVVAFWSSLRLTEYIRFLPINKK